MLVVNSRIRIPDAELSWTFARSSGPGGQNVNKVSSKAVVRWNPGASPSLPADVRERFLSRYRSRLTIDGELIISSQRYRDQARNIEDAKQRLAELLAKVAVAPKKRKPTKPSRASVARRIESKQATSRKKQLRRRISDE